MELVVGILVGLAVGAAGAYLIVRYVASAGLATAREEQRRLQADAERDADALRREAEVASREQAVKLRAEVDLELKDKRSEILRIETRILEKEEEIDRKLSDLDRREHGVSERESQLGVVRAELEEAKGAHLRELERISGLTVNEAKAELLNRSEELVRHEMARMVRQAEEEAQAEAKQRARNLVSDALQRVQRGRDLSPSCSSRRTT
jgi:ribonuclease Y